MNSVEAGSVESREPTEPAGRGLPRLLIATLDCPPARGGIQRMVDELARRSCRRWNVTVLAPMARNAASYDSSVPFRVRRTSRSWDQSHGRAARAFAAMARRERADLLVAAHINLLPALAVGRRHRPLIVMLHGSELWTRQGRLITRALGGRVTQALAVSRFTAQQAADAGIPRSRIALTPPGADIADPRDCDQVLKAYSLLGGTRVVPYLISVSRLDESHKGHDVVIRALPVVLRTNPDLRYVIAGEGHLTDSLRNLAHREGVAHAVQFVGEIDERQKAALLRGCRAFVMVSREQRRPALFEGFGIAFIEAALAGRPSIAGASGGCRDAVIDGETGLLVDPHEPNAVARAAVRLLDDHEYADRLGARARQRALAEFTWEQAIARMSREMEKVLR